MSAVVVSGPGVDGRVAPSVDTGVSLAIYLAERAEPRGTFYVREHGLVAARVEAHEDRTLTITKIEGGAR